MGTHLHNPDQFVDYADIASMLSTLKSEVNFLAQMNGFNERELHAAAVLHSLTQGHDPVSTDKLIELLNAIKAHKKPFN
ncbi:hypothetical protein S2091_0974 [Solimicrobium silvestre]|uniref:Uncharacterized protein n=1 Tax=Solimicrobium silvestre TaxID=2099400 RepID=A0A2S9H338_9BURK|nr:hypothetical protein S2091_0974 [Solimicrobium silvestre]